MTCPCSLFRLWPTGTLCPRRSYLLRSTDRVSGAALRFQGKASLGTAFDDEGLAQNCPVDRGLRLIGVVRVGCTYRPDRPTEHPSNEPLHHIGVLSSHISKHPTNGS